MPPAGRDRGPDRPAAVRRAGILRGLPVRRRSRRILGSNYGYAVAAIDFPRYAHRYLDGKLPIDRLIDRRLPLADLDDAFDRLRAGQAARQVVVFEDTGSG